ncbi:Alcohol dehydrogenase [Nitrospirillum viridazoti Y2]|uniref:NADPH:quinone reductase-like Zn-dependent oxidoreductase n=1 Tax=Nitrospirillum amazonense TaxID=28077 RepID=A0A560INV4_9PROT|nr:NADP-dependent oxidoreductase [Nitrospirillum amazonense]EGX99477.1 Alcohol dehydrogenase [Nitrospirillum amazonense Y2]TWB60658.1 NADPH:quinone reductase-like Zn-dependent oxidoreductase [Nitrospirillum amazonense]
MKAIEFNEYGGPDVLHIVDVEAPRPGPREVRIRVRAAGINPSDWKRREGQYRAFEDVQFPAGLGVEGAGIVDAVGFAVTGVAIGDSVFGFGERVMAEQAVLTHWAKKPDDLSFEVAAGLPVVSDTATRALDQVGVEEGQTLLVSGASGGVGTAIVQLARLRGVTVIGTASATKHDYLRELGVVPTTYGEGLEQRVRELVPGGVDAAIDVAGSGIIPDLIRIVGDPAHVLSVADFSAEEYGAKFSRGPPVDPARLLAAMAALCSAGSFKLHIDRTFPLEQAKQAQEVSQVGPVTGKLVVCVD